MNRPRQSVTHVPLERLTAHPANIRDELGDLTDMARSMTEHGILQPLTVTEDPSHDGKLLILAGHRRLGAAILARLDPVPVIVRHGLADFDEHLVIMLVENTHRRDLNPIERAEAYQALINQGLTVPDIAQRTGHSRSSVTYYLNLLNLPLAEIDEIRIGDLAVNTALARARNERQEERLRQEGRPVGRPVGRETTPYFSERHPLAKAVRARCKCRGVPKVGKTGCGPCWEAVIRADATGTLDSQDPPPLSRRRAKGPHRIGQFDDVVVMRALEGERGLRMSKADRIEIVRRGQAAGMSLKQIGELTGLKTDRYTNTREEAQTA